MNDAVRTMRAMRASSSDPASLTCENVPVPVPGPGELLVGVRGTAVTADELSCLAQAGRTDVRAVYFVVRPDGGQLRELATLIDKQQLGPVVSTVFELAALPTAFQAQRGSRPPGKVVISVSR